MKLINVSKKYKTKSEEVQALNNFSYEFPNNGLVAVTGKSGCGKTTLLYIIAGLLESDNGQIVENSLNLEEYSERQWDDYRNLQIGMIFQDYQLMEDKTVEDNLSIVLDIRSDIDNKELAIKNVLSFVDLENFNKRKVCELSGGQKQRVAIARAIIKNPNIILADEPTGHLDENTSEEIWKLLKKISKEKLVIIVSHDNKKAIAYADNVIEIRDGEILSVADEKDKTYNRSILVEYDDKSKVFDEKDTNSLFEYIFGLCNNGVEIINISKVEESTAKEVVHQESSNDSIYDIRVIRNMPLKRIIKYASSLIIKRKLRHIVAMLMIALTLFLGAVDITVYTYDYYDVMENYIKEYSFPYIKVGLPTGYTDNFYEQYSGNVYMGETVREILFNNFDKKRIEGILSNQIIKNSNGGEISEIRLIHSNGLENVKIKGQFPTKANEIVITDYISNRLGLGKGINSSVYIEEKEFVVTGIIETDYKEYKIIEKILDENVSEIGEYKLSMDYCIAIVNPQYRDEVCEKIRTFSLNATDFSHTKKLSLYLDLELSYGNIEEYKCPIICGRDIQNDNEILISESMLDYLGYTLEDFKNEKDFETKLKYSFVDLHDESFGDYYSGYINFYDFFSEGINIVGVFDEASDENSPYILVSTDIWEKIKSEWKEKYYYSEYILETDFDNVETFIKNLRDNNLYWEEPSVEEMYDIQKLINTLKIFIFLIFIVILIISVVILINCVGFSVKDSASTIGIMRALGVRKNDTFKIFFAESCLVYLVSVLVSFIITFVSVNWINEYFRELHIENPYNIFDFQYKWILILYVVMFLISLLILIIPIHKYSNKKPTELLNTSKE